jgi:hypothetical protein
MDQQDRLGQALPGARPEEDLPARTGTKSKAVQKGMRDGAEGEEQEALARLVESSNEKY